MRRRTFLAGAAALVATPASADASVILLLHGGEPGQADLARAVKEGVDAGTRMVLQVHPTADLGPALRDRNVVLAFALGRLALQAVVNAGAGPPVVHAGVDDASFAANLRFQSAVHPWPDPAEALAEMARLLPRLRRVHVVRAAGDNRAWWDALLLAGRAAGIAVRVVEAGDPRSLAAAIPDAELVWLPPDPALGAPWLEALSPRLSDVVVLGGTAADLAAGRTAATLSPDTPRLTQLLTDLGTAVLAAEPARRLQFTPSVVQVNAQALRRAGVWHRAPAAPG